MRYSSILFISTTTLLLLSQQIAFAAIDVAGSFSSVGSLQVSANPILFSTPGSIWLSGSITNYGSQTLNNRKFLAQFSESSNNWLFPLATPNDQAQAVLVDGNVLTFGGGFTTLRNCSVFDCSSSSSPAGFERYLLNYNFVTDTWYNVTNDRLDQQVRALARNGTTQLYVGGDFRNTQSGIALNRIGLWNGANWIPLSSGTDGSVYALAINGTNLYVGGSFTTAGGQGTARIARWNTLTSSFVPVAAGVTGPVYTLVMWNGFLVVGGYFDVNSFSASNLAKFSGTTWANVGPTGQYPSDAVYKAVVASNSLYIGGNFELIGSGEFPYVARCDSNGNWNPVAFGSNAPVQDLAVAGDGVNVYITAQTTWTSTCMSDIAKYSANVPVADPAFSSTFGDVGLGGMSDSVRQLSTNANYGQLPVVASGDFLSAGDTFTHSQIAKFDGTFWSPIGKFSTSGNGNRIDVILVNGSKIYVAGSFNSIDGITAANIAMFDGSTWQPLGSGLQGRIYSMIISGNDLIVAGDNILTNTQVVKWSGSGNPVYIGGQGTFDNWIYKIATFGGLLYASTTSGRTYVGNGTAAGWTLLFDANTNNLNNLNFFLTTQGYCGAFRGGSARCYNGSAWNNFGTMTIPGDAVNFFQHPNGNYYIQGGGYFSRYTGAGWSNLITGNDVPNGYINTATMLPDSFLIGGDFTTIGGVCRPFITRYYLSPIAPTPRPVRNSSATLTDGLLTSSDGEGNSLGAPLIAALAVIVLLCCIIVCGILVLLILARVRPQTFNSVLKRTSGPDQSTLDVPLHTGENGKRFSVKPIVTGAAQISKLRTEFGNDFVLEGIVKGPKIGAGSYGDVFIGDWLAQKVALKTFKSENFESFAEEVRVAKKLNSPAVVRLFGVTEIQDSTFVVLEYCANGSLLSWLRSEHGVVAQHSLLVRLAHEAAKSLVVLEKTNTIHRDIAARNFLLDSSLNVKLSDFGLAKQNAEQGIYKPSSEAALPVRWSSIEVLLRNQFSLASDRYAFGVTIWEILSDGTPPFVAYSNAEFVSQAVTKRELPKLDRPQTMSELEYELIMQLTHANPENRPMMSEIVERLYKLEQSAIEIEKKLGPMDARPMSMGIRKNTSEVLEENYQTLSN